jgi:hypothetical protein
MTKRGAVRLPFGIHRVTAVISRLLAIIVTHFRE